MYFYFIILFFFDKFVQLTNNKFTMKKIATLILVFIAAMNTLQAQTSGGPDTYGYIWRDSNDPSGPVYNWIDVLPLPGAQKVRFLADDNTIGSFPIGFSFHFYWYDVTQFWVGSNGYMGFTNGQLSSPFNVIPNIAAPQNFLAAMESDLLFDITNSAECWRYTNAAQDTLILSWINVPFYDASIAAGNGTNTFQIILSAVDSSITYQYQTQIGAPAAALNTAIGIENISGNIGLMHSYNVLPPTSYAIKYYFPSSSTYSVYDAATTFNDNTETGGLFLSKNGTPFTMKTGIKNTGNQNLPAFNVYSRVYNSLGTIQVADNAMSLPLVPAASQNITMINTFNPTTAGTFQYVTNTQYVGDATPSNDQKIQELVVVDTSVASIRLSYDDGVDAGLGGLNWIGGAGGAGIYYVPPFYPCKVSDMYAYIVANPNFFGYSMSIYDDNGAFGTPGTKLDSVYVNPSSVLVGSWNTIPLTTPLVINSGGIYVAWQMNGIGLTLGQNQNAPFSNRTFEILSNTWAIYRFRETEDLMINLNVSKIPVSGAGVSENELGNYFGNFYPNPSVGTTVLNYDLPFAFKTIKAELYDVQGKLISLPIGSEMGSGRIRIDTGALSAGVYTCKIIVDDNAGVMRKLVIAK
jgi:Secretion system C-terminal sorting domain